MAQLRDFCSQRVGVGSSLNLLIVACALSPSVAADLGTVQGVQWSPHVEWTVRNLTWSGNAFDVRAMVEFTHASSGDTVRTGCFFRAGTPGPSGSPPREREHGRSSPPATMTTWPGTPVE